MSLHIFGMSRATAVGRTVVRDIGRGVALCGRGTVSLSGLAALTLVLTLAASERTREQALAWVQSMTAMKDGSAADGSRDGSPGTPARWSDWLATVPEAGLAMHQEHVARYLSRRYKVAENAVRPIVGEAFNTGRAIGVDPMLILAVMAIESSLNPFAQSSMGAQGLMQVMTRVHSEKFVSHGGDEAALDPIVNLRVGAEILKDVIRRGGSVERGLQLYVGAGNLPDDGGYGARVLGELGRIRMAAAGDVRAALSAGGRADNPVSGKPAQLLPAGNPNGKGSSTQGQPA